MREMAYPSTVFRLVWLNTLDLSTIVIMCTQLFKLRLSPSKAEKSNTSAKCLLGIAKSFNCNILLELVFLGIQDPMFQTFLVFFKIISVISGIFVYLYQVYRIPGPPPPPGRPQVVTMLFQQLVYKICSQQACSKLV